MVQIQAGNNSFMLEEKSLQKFHFCRYEANITELDSGYLKCMQQAVEYFHQQLLGMAKLDENSFIDQYLHVMLHAHEQASYKESKFGESGMLRTLPISMLRPNAILYAQRVAKDFDLAPPMPGKVIINDVDEMDWPMNHRTGVHDYAVPQAFKKYFESAGKTIINYLQQMKAGGNLDDARKLVGEYFHTLINARPFGHVNNSLIMGQVNYLLLNTEHSGILHGDLDHLFTRFDYPDAMKIWVQAIDGKLPIAAEYGIDVRGNPTN